MLQKKYFIVLLSSLFLVDMMLTKCIAALNLKYVNPMAMSQGSSGELEIYVEDLGDSDEYYFTFTNPGITVNSVSRKEFKTSRTTFTVSISIAPDAPIGVSTVTIVDIDGGTSDGEKAFYVTPSYPSITAVDPQYIKKGEETTLNIIGSGFTNATSVKISNLEGSDKNYSPTVLGVSHIVITVPGADTSSAEIGWRDITVTTSNGELFAPGIVMITDSPSISSPKSYNPLQLTQGAMGVWVTVTGNNFLNGAWPSFSGGGIYVSADPDTGEPLVEFVNSGQIKFAVDVSEDAPIGKRTLTITNPDGSIGEATDSVEIVEYAYIESVDPSVIIRPSEDNNYSIRVFGQGFISTTTFSNPIGEVYVDTTPVTIYGGCLPFNNMEVGGFTILGSTLIGSTELQITFEVSKSTSIGYRDVSFTNGDGTLVKGNGVLLITGVPKIDPIQPSQLTQGAQGVWVTVTGNNFLNGIWPSFSGGGVYVANDSETGEPLIEFVNNSTIRFAVDVAQDAPVGIRTLTLTNPGGASGDSSNLDSEKQFQILEYALIESVEPSVITKPESGVSYKTIRIFGKGFIEPVKLESMGEKVERTINFDPTTHSDWTSTNTFVSALLSDTGKELDEYAHYNFVEVITSWQGAPPDSNYYYQVYVGTGIYFVQDTDYIGSTEIRVKIGVTGGSLSGKIDINLLNAYGTSNETKIRGPGLLEIKAPLKITSVSPTRLSQGSENEVITVSGQGFDPDFNATMGAGVTVNGVNYLSEDTVEVYVSVPDNATLGLTDLVIWNPDGREDTYSDFEIIEPLEVTSVEPGRIGLGVSNITLTIKGRNFVSSGGYIPSISINGTGVTLDSTTVNFLSSTELQVNASVSLDAPVGFRDITVTNPDSDGRIGVGNNVLEIYNPVSVTSVIDQKSGVSSLVRGSTYYIRIRGSGFLSNPTVNISGTGVVVDPSKTTHVSNTEVVAYIDVKSTATVGARDVEVINTDGTRGRGDGIIEIVKPLNITSVSPSSIGTGAEGHWLKLTGEGVINGATVDFSGSGISIDDTLYASRNELDIKITVSASAEVGKRDIRVINPDGQINLIEEGLEITLQPVVNSVSPSSLSQGAKEQWLSIKGNNFYSSSTVTIGQGILISSTVYNSQTEMRVKVDVAENADVGVRDVYIKNPDGKEGTGFGVFEVEKKLNISKITPTGLAYGVSNKKVIVEGSNFKENLSAYFVDSDGEQASGFSSKITYYSETYIELDVSINMGVSPGNYYLKLVNPDNSYNTKSFNVLTPPVINSVSPSKLKQGDKGVWIDVYGTGFKENTRISFSGTGISVSRDSDGNELSRYVSSSQLQVAVDVDDNALVGTRDVIATNPDGSSGIGKGLIGIGMALEVTSAIPSAMMRKQKGWVNLKGKGIENGANLNVSVSGSDVSVSSVTYLGSTEIRFWVEVSSVALPGGRDIILTNGDGTEVIGSALLSVDVPIEVTSIDPVSVAQGKENRIVMIYGYGFKEGTDIVFSGGGIKLNSLTYKNDRILEANITVSPDATLGRSSIRAVNPDGWEYEAKDIFEVVEPVEVISVEPIRVGKGVSDYEIRVKGNNFKSGLSVSISGKGITVDNSSVKFLSETEISFNIDVDVDANTGFRDIIITNPDDNDGKGEDLLEIYEAVKIQSIVEKENGISSLVRGSTYWLRIRGDGFLENPVITFGSGITVSSTNYISSSEIEVLVDVDSDASVGSRDVELTNSDGTRAKIYGAIDVVKPLSLSSVKPDSLGSGTEGYWVKILGEGIMKESSISIDSNYIEIVEKKYISQYEIDAKINIDEDAEEESVDVTVTNPDGQTKTITKGFNITSQPVINNVSPDSLPQGAKAQWITITGNNFFSSSTVNMGEGIDITSFTYVSSKVLKVEIDINKGANTGTRDVMVLNPDGKFGMGIEKFSVSKGPSIVSVTPYRLVQGMDNKNILITGSGFQEGFSLSFGEAGFVVNRMTYLNTEKIEVNLDVPATVSPGNYSVYIVNPDSSSASLTNYITVEEGPTLFDVVPNLLIQGVQKQLTLKGLNFDSDIIVVISGTGINITNTKYVDENTLTVDITVDNDATEGFRSVSIITSDGVSVKRDEAINVVPPLEVDNLSKSVFSQGDEEWVSIRGKGFLEGAKVTLTGDGVSIDTYTFISSQEIKVKIKVELDSDVGSYDLVVTNPDGSSYMFSAGITVEELDFSEASYVYPSPVKKGVSNFRFILKEEAFMEIKVYDVLGRKVWEKEGQGEIGENIWQWNCVDTYGNSLGSGIYIYQIEANYEDKVDKVIKKLVIIRGK